MSVFATIRSRLASALMPAAAPVSSRSWFPIVREPYTGAWQKNDSISKESLLSNPAVFTCIQRISQDIAKLPVNLVSKTSEGIWQSTFNSAYSAVLRRPNHYQSMPRFVEQWVSSKLTWGNTYVLKHRDGRGVVDALHIQQPSHVTPLVAPDGSIYYELRKPDVDLTGLWMNGQDGSAIVPAREMVHDRWNCYFHPLVGLPPLYAAALAAEQGNVMQRQALELFANGNMPSGVLSVPTKLTPDVHARLTANWSTRVAGSVYIAEDGQKFEGMDAASYVDSQFFEQLNWTTEQIAMVFGVPLFLLNSTKGAAYAANEPLIQLYHDEGLQPVIVSLEQGFDEGLELDPSLGVELDIDDLIWLDTNARTKAANETVRGGILSPNEARAKYFSMPGVDGGDSPMMQQQQFSLAALQQRDESDPFSKPQAALPAAPAEPEPEP